MLVWNWFTNCVSLLTPSDEYKSPEVFVVWPEGHEDETVEVEALNQDPEVVGGKKIDEEQHCHFAAHLIKKHEYQQADNNSLWAGA